MPIRYGRSLVLAGLALIFAVLFLLLAIAALETTLVIEEKESHDNQGKIPGNPSE